MSQDAAAGGPTNPSVGSVRVAGYRAGGTPMDKKAKVPQKPKKPKVAKGKDAGATKAK